MAEDQAGSSTDPADIEEARNVDEPPRKIPRAATRLETETTVKVIFSGFEASKTVEVEKVIILSFRTLQLQRIAELQDDLLHLTVASAATGVSPGPDKKEVDKALRDYAEALRNYETLSLHAQPDIPPGARLVGRMARISQHENFRKPRFRDAFLSLVSSYLDLTVVSSDRMRNTTGIPTNTAYALSDIIRTVIERKDDISTKHVLQSMETTFGNLGFRELDQKGREERSQKNALTQRIIMALFGGTALIGPMLIMTLHQSRNTSLITSSVATFVFALVMAFAARDSAGKDVLAITAAYAAVLVVFVGTSTTPNS